MPVWLLAIAAVALVAWLLRWAARPPTGAAVASWAASHDLTLDPAARGDVSRQLRRGRWLRTLGFVVPFGIGQGAMVWWVLVFERPLPPASMSVLADPSAWAAGYLLGAVAAELTRERPHPRQVRAAVLAPRRLADYLPGWMLWSERAVALAVLGLVPLASGGPGRAVPTAVAAIVLATTVEIGLRAMVRRPQPVASTGELAVDDALRSTALHRAAGAGLAALLFLLGNQLGVLDRRWWVLTGFLALVCYGLAIGCWKDLTSPLWWPIRRGTGPTPPPAARPHPRQAPRQGSA
jgi:hypothetical protein